MGRDKLYSVFITTLLLAWHVRRLHEIRQWLTSVQNKKQSEALQCSPVGHRYALLPLFKRFPFAFSEHYPDSLEANKYNFHVVDWLTLWPECFPMSDKSAHTVAKILLQQIIYHSMSVIVTDNGHEFANKTCSIHFNASTYSMPIHRYTTQRGNTNIQSMHTVTLDVLSKHNTWSFADVGCTLFRRSWCKFCQLQTKVLKLHHSSSCAVDKLGCL